MGNPLFSQLVLSPFILQNLVHSLGQVFQLFQGVFLHRGLLFGLEELSVHPRPQLPLLHRPALHFPLLDFQQGPDLLFSKLLQFLRKDRGVGLASGNFVLDEGMTLQGAHKEAHQLQERRFHLNYNELFAYVKHLFLVEKLASVFRRNFRESQPGGRFRSLIGSLWTVRVEFGHLRGAPSRAETVDVVEGELFLQKEGVDCQEYFGESVG